MGSLNPCYRLLNQKGVPLTGAPFLFIGKLFKSYRVIINTLQNLYINRDLNNGSTNSRGDFRDRSKLSN